MLESSFVPSCALVGWGVCGRNHQRALARMGVPVTAVLDPAPERQASAAAEGLTPVASYEEALDREPGFWDVCVPTSGHPDALAAISALDPDASILVEKPLCDFADLARVRSLLDGHHGKVVISENYASSTVPVAISALARLLRLSVTKVYAEMTKNRTLDFAAGRFTDHCVGALGYEGTHLITVIEDLGVSGLDAVPGQVTMTDLTLPDGTVLPRQGSADVTIRTGAGCDVRLYTSVDGVIGHVHPPYPPAKRRIPVADDITRHRVLCVEGQAPDGSGWHLTGYFDPVPGQARGRAMVLAFQDGVLAGPPRWLDDDTIAQHLTAALAHFAGAAPDPFSADRAMTQVEYLRTWADHATRTLEVSA